MFFGLLAISCAEEYDTMDPKLVGTWTDTNTDYVFNEDLTYGIKYLRRGVVPDSIFIDSVYGEVLVDLERSNLTFNLLGYYLKGDTAAIDSSLNSTTWHYEITDDTLLHYESNTMSGTLTKK